MAEALSNLSDFFSFLQDATGVVGDKAEFAVHGLTRDDDGKLTYSRVKFTDSESLDLTNNEGFVFGGMEDIINGTDPYGEYYNQYLDGDDTYIWEERQATKDVRIDTVSIKDPGSSLLVSSANIANPTADYAVNWGNINTANLGTVSFDVTGYVQTADVTDGGQFSADGVIAIIDPPFKDTGSHAKMTLTSTLNNTKYNITAATVTDVGTQYAKVPTVNFIGGGNQEQTPFIKLNMAYMVQVFNFTGFVTIDRTNSNVALRQPNITITKTLGETGQNPTTTSSFNLEDLTYWTEKDIIFGDVVTLKAFSPTLNRTDTLVNGVDFNVVFEQSLNKTRRIQLTGSYIPYIDDEFVLNVSHPSVETDYNNKYKKQSQIRFDNNKLYYYIDTDGMLVARYAENYDYAVGPQ